MLQTIKNKIRSALHNEAVRQRWVEQQLEALQPGGKLLDAGCGSQQYRQFCNHLEYHGQDFGQYSVDDSDGFTSLMGGESGYSYGKLDYFGDIWAIDEKDAHFDAILCTEVFEHIPFPNETILEFARLLKPDGRLLLTLPANCLRHMDPYYFYSGFSDRYLQKFLVDAGFEIETLLPVGDYYSWLAMETARTMNNHGLLARALLTPALFWFMQQPATKVSVNTLCMGYHVVAKRLSPRNSAQA
jgi:SAM-dependent methyltransferase